MIKKTYQIKPSREQINQIIDFLKTHHFMYDEDYLFGNRYYFINENYRIHNSSVTYIIKFVMNVQYNEIVFEVDVDNQQDLNPSIEKYIHLLFETCYSIIKNNDYKVKKWKSFNNKQNNMNNLGKTIKGVLNVLEVISEVID